MVGNAFQRGARNVGHGGAAGQPGDGAARVRLPVGRAQTGEGGHHHHAAGVGHAFSQRLHLGAALDGIQPITQPLHHGPADKHAAFNGELGLRGCLRCTGGEQAVVRGLKVLARVHQHEATGAVGVFGHAGLEAGLAEQGALLVARHAADGDGMAQQVGADLAEVGAGRVDLRHQ